MRQKTKSLLCRYSSADDIWYFCMRLPFLVYRYWNIYIPICYIPLAPFATIINMQPGRPFPYGAAVLFLFPPVIATKSNPAAWGYPCSDAHALNTVMRPNTFAPDLRSLLPCSWFSYPIHDVNIYLLYSEHPASLFAHIENISANTPCFMHSLCYNRNSFSVQSFHSTKYCNLQHVL